MLTTGKYGNGCGGFYFIFCVSWLNFSMKIWLMKNVLKQQCMRNYGSRRVIFFPVLHPLLNINAHPHIIPRPAMLYLNNIWTSGLVFIFLKNS